MGSGKKKDIMEVFLNISHDVFTVEVSSLNILNSFPIISLVKQLIPCQQLPMKMSRHCRTCEASEGMDRADCVILSEPLD